MQMVCFEKRVCEVWSGSLFFPAYLTAQWWWDSKFEKETDREKRNEMWKWNKFVWNGMILLTTFFRWGFSVFFLVSLLVIRHILTLNIKHIALLLDTFVCSNKLACEKLSAQFSFTHEPNWFINSIQTNFTLIRCSLIVSYYKSSEFNQLFDFISFPVSKFLLAYPTNDKQIVRK